MSHVAVPSLYGQVKIYKEGHPLRPVVAFYDEPTVKLACYLVNMVSFFLPEPPPFSVRDSVDFANRLSTRHFPRHAVIVSFDAVEIFTKIDVQQSIGIIHQRLLDAGAPTPMAEEAKTLLELCCRRNYCAFRGNTYVFPDGLPMGGPLSSLLANWTMATLEDFLFSNSSSSYPVGFWCRYVDDIFCVWEGTGTQLDSFLFTLNSFFPRLKFTLEYGGTFLPFLDLRITLTENQNRLTPSLEVYRKATYTGVGISASSFHPHFHKMAALTSMVHRLLSLPLSPQAFEKERLILEAIRKKNGTLVDLNKLINRKKRRMIRQRSTSLSRIDDQPRRKFLRMPYLGKVSDQLSRILKRFDCQAAYYPLLTLISIASPKFFERPSPESDVITGGRGSQNTSWGVGENKDMKHINFMELKI